MNTAIMRAFGGFNTWVYRRTGGRVLGRFPSGAPVCLLTTKGRRSGRRRTAPLLFLRDGEAFIVVGSQGGAPVHPGWYLNLRADPHAELQIGSRRMTVMADDVGDADRERLWPKLLAMYPSYEAYRKRTSRKIPVVRLTPAAAK